MVFKCCVPHCSNYTNTNIFSIPKNYEARKKWINAIGIREENITSTTRVCFRHFSEDNFYQFSTCRKLKKGIVPSIDLTNEPNDSGTKLKTEQQNRIEMGDIGHVRIKIEDDLEDIVQIEIVPADLVQNTKSNHNIETGFTAPVQIKTEDYFEYYDKIQIVAQNDDLIDTKTPLPVEIKIKSEDTFDDHKNLFKRTAKSKNEKIIKKIKRKRKFRFTKPRCFFFIENFMHNDKKIFYYTGIQTYKVFCVVFKFVLRSEETNKRFKMVSRRLTSMNEFFLTLMRLRKGFSYQILADMFQISSSVAMRIFSTWIHLMYSKLGSINIWPHRDVLIENAPTDFLKKYPNVLGCMTYVEFHMASVAETLKSLIMIDGNGCIIFVSPLFSGCTSEEKIIEESNFNSILKRKIAVSEIMSGDVILADKEFNVIDLLADTGNTLNIPTFRITGIDLQPNYIEKIAPERINVAKAIRKLKSFTILTKRIPLSLQENFNRVYTVCALLTNFRYHLKA